MTLTGKQKRYLQAMGHSLTPVLQIGKTGLSDAVVKSAQQVLQARELIKVRILQNSPLTANEAFPALAEATGAQLVQVVGSNGLLYLQNEEKPLLVLPD